MNISLESVLQSCHLVQVESCIQKPVLNRESVLAVFLDIEKPYDMIWRRRLFIKMQNIGIGVKKNARLGEKLFSETVIRVRIGKTYSDTMDIEIGTSQGIVISPTLFNIAIKDLPSFLHPMIPCTLFDR